MSNKLISSFLVAMAALAQAPPVDFIAPELRAYLKLDAVQAKTINGLIGDYYAFANDQLSDYMDLQDKIDRLRHEATLDPQAIGLALADPIAAEITIERKLDAKLIETEKAAGEGMASRTGRPGQDRHLSAAVAGAVHSVRHCVPRLACEHDFHHSGPAGLLSRGKSASI